MDENTTREQKILYFAAPDIERVFGRADALDRIDAITAVLIVGHIENRRIDTIAQVALRAIAEVAKHDPATARRLINSLG